VKHILCGSCGKPLCCKIAGSTYPTEEQQQTEAVYQEFSAGDSFRGFEFELPPAKEGTEWCPGDEQGSYILREVPSLGEQEQTDASQPDVEVEVTGASQPGVEMEVTGASQPDAITTVPMDTPLADEEIACWGVLTDEGIYCNDVDSD